MGARSWDRFAVPLPWSTVYNLLSEPITVPPDLSKARRNELRGQVEDLFIRLTAAAEEWAAGGPRPMSMPLADRRAAQKLSA